MSADALPFDPLAFHNQVHCIDHHLAVHLHSSRANTVIVIELFHWCQSVVGWRSMREIADFADGLD